MKRNIKITYLLSYLKHSWFWIGIWVFYYLRFTDYAGIGLIETVMIGTMSLSEIPTGAIGDLFGKRVTLFIGFFMESAGNFIMAFAPNFNVLVLSVIIMSFGGSMYSGTSEALAYDSLKQIGKERNYNKVTANSQSFQWIAVTLTGIIGGLLYKINPSYPFIASGIFFFIGALLCLLIHEPRIDTEKFSIRNFINQNKIGLRSLFINSEVKRLTLFLAAIGAIIVLSWEMLDGILGMEFGYDPLGLSVLSAVLFLAAAGASQLTAFLHERFGASKAIIFLAIITIVTFLVSPIAGLIIGGLSLILRSAVQTIIVNLTSVVINENVESKYRATALSSFNMFKNLPYVLSAYLLGSLMDTITARNFAFVLGVLLGTLLLINSIRTKNTSKRYAKM
ncbi:MAG: major facilitator superfamily permease [uncultured bacterium]|uniref:Major facilitator superfamily (MFS) profile domain-containing protein n=1 Tax=Candidatus Woesebacteria bacterium RIFCSPHIGHO2_12_FULL_41_24 TaxID=1802510 RepID=A0A1F8AV20_9BACT|nr:MAG: major facilitator superfamily permease [uncultured bacterium]OGM14815.1 MAG: hypothetical protein A2W15_00555 [Candidatus Woesebacteria bacterium RBG_16_41_13]OGM30307.1 MAG: hypothetical protein A2873_05260 [Candidatus Woesebacteria bacterium RIFCSPHIGHO2_01_FULL_42_80]OGM34346.1 MAG: hypothetical protein A3D84_04840 [Candidatus Woesebacteria bacterium RIFCSPHIGHO2_02_FULL_42_20]OGM55480.1 MAG: hypothetical protein A3E44_00995 [Candidatus Woesebacteria bacterium RIFCSPHIGHO2_12_FULL_41